ncbi:hypothetical protein JB92DRAFT_1809361 [Gautieria morchelliformis]|nr:hypothetical protein JB92DRAFT_1809361 [Gautieria morchelliformis]
MLPHCCKYCHRSFRTRQGLRAHLTTRASCHLAHEASLAQQAIRRYDPHDPEALFREDDPPLGWEDEAIDVTFDDIGIIILC